MKYLASVLLAAVLTTASASADPTGSNSQGAAASVEPDGFLRPKSSPTPASSSAAASGPRKPITASLGKDGSGKGSMTAFASSDPSIYCVWKAETGTKGEKVRVAWYSDGAKGKKLTENTQTIPGAGSISGSAHIEKPATGFPAGKYRADVYDDGKLAKSLPFTITK